MTPVLSSTVGTVELIALPSTQDKPGLSPPMLVQRRRDGLQRWSFREDAKLVVLMFTDEDDDDDGGVDAVVSGLQVVSENPREVRGRVVSTSSPEP